MRILSPKNEKKLNDQRAELIEKLAVPYSLDLDRLDGDLWEKFWKYTELGTGCWTWQGAISAGRYGHVWMNNKNIYAHRVSWALHYGPIKQGELVLHKCDNPKCVNPSHLFIGTHQDNMDDCMNKGRIAKGSVNGRSKLKEEQVLEIKTKLASEKYYHQIRDLALEYGVKDSTIYHIKRGFTWKHVLVKMDVCTKPSKYVVNGEEVKLTDKDQ